MGMELMDVVKWILKLAMKLTPELNFYIIVVL